MGRKARPKLLDLFCGAGGCAVGYHRAGFDVIGVDHLPMPRYPFRFIEADAMEYAEKYGKEFDAIHASPPCQRYSVATAVWHGGRERHPDLIEPVRQILIASGKPYVVENVMGAPLQNAVMLCGTMFGLKVFRHRLFESTILLAAPAVHPKHDGSTGSHRGYSTVARSRGGYICVAGHNFVPREGAEAMGINWMQFRRELSQAIPPAYTEFIGRQLMTALEGMA